MKKRILTLIMSIAMVITCGLSLVGCGKKDKETTEPTATGIAISMATDKYKIENGVISVEYGSKVSISAADISVVLIYDNETTTALAEKTETTEGYVFASTLPDDEITAAGDYKISATYGDFSAEVVVKVLKLQIDMSSVKWNYDDSFVYTGKDFSVELTGVPEGVSVSYENNFKIAAGKYQAVANFTVENSEVYADIEPMTLDWEIEKAHYELGDYYVESTEYNGEEFTTEVIGLNSEVTYSFAEGSVATATVAGKYTVYIDFELVDEIKDNYYPIDRVTKTWDINKAQIKLSQNKTLIYNGTEQSISKEDFDAPEGITIESIEPDSRINAGEYSVIAHISIDDSVKANYIFAESVSANWNISKAPLTATANPVTIKYGADFPTITVSYDGFIGSDDESVVTGTLTYYSNYAVGRPVGEYYIIPEGLVSSNYEIEFEQGILTVEKAIVDASKLSFNIEETVYFNGKDVVVDLVNETGATFDYKWTGDKTAAEIGNYSVSVEIELDERSLSNFEEFSTIMTLDWEIVDIVKNYKIDLVSFANGSMSEGVNTVSSSDPHFYFINYLLTNVSVEYINGFGDYKSVVYKDAAMTTVADYTDLSVSKYYVVLLNNNDKFIAVREVEVEYGFAANNLSFNANSNVSVNTDADSYSVDFAASQFVSISSKLKVGDGEAVQTIELDDGVTVARLLLEFVYIDKTYSYSSDIVITKSADSDVLFTNVAFSDGENPPVAASGNEMSTNFNISNIDEFAESVNNGQTAINIELDLANTDGYAVGQGANAPKVEKINGCYFLVVTLVDETTLPVSQSARKVYRAGEPLPNKVCYIRLIVDGVHDSKVAAEITIETKDGKTNISSTTSKIVIHDIAAETVSIESENEYATIKILDSLNKVIYSGNGLDEFSFMSAGFYKIQIIATDKVTTTTILVEAFGEPKPALKVEFVEGVDFTQISDYDGYPTVGDYEFDGNFEQSFISMTFTAYAGDKLDSLVSGNVINVSKLEFNSIESAIISFGTSTGMQLVEEPYENFEVEVLIDEYQHCRYICLQAEGELLGRSAVAMVYIYLMEDPNIKSSNTDIIVIDSNLWYTAEQTYYSDVDLEDIGIDEHSLETNEVVVNNWSTIRYIEFGSADQYVKNIEIYDKNPLEDNTAELIDESEYGLVVYGIPAGTYYVIVTAEDETTKRLITLKLIGDIDAPLVSVSWNNGTDDAGDDIYFAEQMTDTGVVGDFDLSVDMSDEFADITFIGYFGDSSVSAIEVENEKEYFIISEIDSAVKDHLYFVADKTDLISNLTDVKLEVKKEMIGTTEIKYVEFFMIGEITDNNNLIDIEHYIFGSQTAVSAIKVYLCSKDTYQAAKDYQATISFNEKDYNFNLDWNNWFDFENLTFDMYNGFIYVEGTKEDFGMAAEDDTMTITYSTASENQDNDYVLLFNDGIDMICSGSKIEDIITAGFAFKPTTANLSKELTLTFDNGVAMVAVVVEGGYKAVPIYFFIEDVVSDELKDELVETIDIAENFEFSITVNGETVSTENGDFAYDGETFVARVSSNIGDCIKEINDPYFDGQTMTVLDYSNLSIGIQSAKFIDSYQQVMTDEIYFQVVYTAYGNGIHITVSIPDVYEFYFTIIFADSTAGGQGGDPGQGGAPQYETYNYFRVNSQYASIAVDIVRDLSNGNRYVEAPGCSIVENGNEMTVEFYAGDVLDTEATTYQVASIITFGPYFSAGAKVVDLNSQTPTDILFDAGETGDVTFELAEDVSKDCKYVNFSITDDATGVLVEVLIYFTQPPMA